MAITRVHNAASTPAGKSINPVEKAGAGCGVCKEQFGAQFWLLF